MRRASNQGAIHRPKQAGYVQSTVSAFAEFAADLSRTSISHTATRTACAADQLHGNLAHPHPRSSWSSVLLVGTVVSGMHERMLESLGQECHIRVAVSGAEALELLYAASCDAIAVASFLPDLDVSEFRQLCQELFPSCKVLSLADFLPSTPETNQHEQVAPLSDGIPAPSGERNEAPGWQGMLGSGPAMQRVYRAGRLVAKRNTTVLIQGESGTGKDVLARAIHNASDRAKQPLVVINCAAIPEALLESELFGYARGSFTGATQSRMGRVHAADGGTLFLDEIGDMPLTLQGKILRFLEQGEVQRIGESETFKVDCRVIAATNVNIKAQVQAKQFREDLYYRLCVFPIELPPLRDRLEDLAALSGAFLNRFSPKTGLHPEALQMLMGHAWPGNVRELRNVVERATLFAEGRPEILPEDIVL